MIVVKHKYIPGRRGAGRKLGSLGVGKALAHVKYIQHRPGPDREKGGREFFNEREDRLDAREMREAIQELGDGRVVVHKVTLAPEINPQDKKAFTREVMDNLSRDMGRDLQWYAVEHNNTDHHHIHVVVLGEDRNGSEVKITLKEIDTVKEYGDRYLERWHPRELEQSRKEREERERERREERTREREVAREERIREGLELPWLHQKIVREQLEPYKEWKEKQDRDEREPKQRKQEPERPYHQDTIEAAGREWSKANNLKELRDLNEYLWDNYEERLPKDEYRKLSSWIRDKERHGERNDKAQPPKEEKRNRDEFEFQGDKYNKKDSYEKLSGLANKLRDSEERLPFNDYQKLRGWMESRDRERFSGVLEKQIELTHKQFERSKTSSDLKAQEGGRVVDPMQEALMRNPIIGLFMTEAAIASEIVRSIHLDDRNRDYVKEQRQGLEDAKRDLDDREKERWKDTWHMPWDLVKSQEERDREAREAIEKAIEKNKEAKAREREKEKEKEAEREREKRDRDNFERGGWY